MLHYLEDHSNESWNMQKALWGPGWWCVRSSELLCLVKLGEEIVLASEVHQAISKGREGGV